MASNSYNLTFIRGRNRIVFHLGTSLVLCPLHIPDFCIGTLTLLGGAGSHRGLGFDIHVPCLYLFF